MLRLVFTFVFTSWILLASNAATPALADGTDKLANILKKIDNLVCTNPEKLTPILQRQTRYYD